MKARASVHTSILREPGRVLAGFTASPRGPTSNSTLRKKIMCPRGCTWRFVSPFSCVDNFTRQRPGAGYPGAQPATLKTGCFLVHSFPSFPTGPQYEVAVLHTNYQMPEEQGWTILLVEWGFGLNLFPFMLQFGTCSFSIALSFLFIFLRMQPQPAYRPILGT